jgi:hypothetical protein
MIVTAHQYILGRDLGAFDYNAELQKCSKCGKERALIEDQMGDVTEIAVWRLKELMHD